MTVADRYSRDGPSALGAARFVVTWPRSAGRMPTSQTWPVSHRLPVRRVSHVLEWSQKRPWTPGSEAPGHVLGMGLSTARGKHYGRCAVV